MSIIGINKIKYKPSKPNQKRFGFLRIRNGENPLDNTAVHPESYEIAEKLYGQDLDS